MPELIAIIVIGLAILIAIISFWLSCYRKVDQGFALIINTMKAEPVVTFTGGVVMPIIHRTEVMDISVKTIEVDRRGSNGLICMDNVRADIKVTFFVRVNKTTADVLKVASSVGVKRASDTKTLEELFQAKFSEALKTVGKRLDFIDLYNERQRFKEAITEVIGKDLNGYVLEDTAIDYLEQTPLSSLDPDNILDAQGRKKIIDLTSAQKVQANAIQREAEKAIKKQDVEAREAVLALERQQADAEAMQQREIETVKSRESAEIAKVAAEEHKRAEAARIAAEQELQIARELAQREVEVAQKARERVIAVESERVEKERALEAINRERATELSRIEKEKALEVERKQIADVIRERVAVEKNVAQEEERIKDLRATMEAERIKTVALAKASEAAEAARIKELVAAEAAEKAAVHMAKEKLVLAEAELTAAEKLAQAAIRQAEGTQASEAAKGLALVRVQQAEARAIEERGKAEAAALEAKMEAEARGLSEKAESMKALSDSTREHEEFRLRLEKELNIEKAGIEGNIAIASQNAQVLAEALKQAKIDIVGGDGQFLDRFFKAISFGKAIDGAASRSEILSTGAAEYTSGQRSLPEDLMRTVADSRFSPGDLKQLMSAWLLKRIGDEKDPSKMLAKAKELGLGELAGWLQQG